MKLKKPPLPIPLLMLIGIVAISFSAIFIKWSDAPASIQGMYRLLFTSLLMLPFARPYSGAAFALRKKDWLMLILSGAMLALHFLLWMGSLKYTSVASSTMIMALEPVFIMLGVYFLYKEKTALSAILGLGIAIGGVVFIGWGDIGISADNLKGDLLSVGGTVAVAVHMLIGQKLVVRMPSYLYSLIVFLSAAGVFAVYNLFMGISFFNYPAKEWGIFVLLAVVPTVFGHILFNWLLQYVSATTVSMNILGEPVGASILAYLLLGEQLTTLQWAGGLLVMIGLAVYLYAGRRKTIRMADAIQNAS
ncbi:MULTISPECIES: DMT family transporter [Paenibacillus]|uniref:DMT family transporter n=1 Tax=Paenibacillus TaxID=44249 RepID=UPI00158DE4AF|nr:MULTISPECIES: DMT family transporter [Paenibacillus]MDH6428586.1 drug/metabolite transporter (DMT)-like permease [Paenibacillus sp. PastH-4]MDH6443776.1 drug/metabolite transporter (DMT)-like permease [Paenibacillus sp. PastF-4]MDH6527684.1 drug/metabolite transporter (DMT)-like permease [Paenibacillus sp. PastH-3]MEC0134014.1 DMT family transporter [Paenibacillus odorifer]MEC0222700.1 DMT family transporter [Paenibacillus odorifer]